MRACEASELSRWFGEGARRSRAVRAGWRGLAGEKGGTRDRGRGLAELKRGSQPRFAPRPGACARPCDAPSPCCARPVDHNSARPLSPPPIVPDDASSKDRASSLSAAPLLRPPSRCLPFAGPRPPAQAPRGSGARSTRRTEQPAVDPAGNLRPFFLGKGEVSLACARLLGRSAQSTGSLMRPAGRHKPTSW